MKDHNENNSQINMWIPRQVLIRWDEYCTQKRLKRTALIRTAVEDYLNKEIMVIKQNPEDNKKITELTTKIDKFQSSMDSLLAKVGKEAQTKPLDSKLAAKVHKLLSESKRGLRSDELADLLIAPENSIIDLLSVVKGIYKLNQKDGRWNVILDDN